MLLGGELAIVCVQKNTENDIIFLMLPSELCAVSIIFVTVQKSK